MNAFNIGNLHIPLPIIQGGMGVGISLSGLASAVAIEGGVGVISTVGLGMIENSHFRDYRKRNIAAIRKEIQKARKIITRGVLGVNIMTVLSNYEDMVRTSVEEGIDIIFSGAGLPLDLPSYIEENDKTKLVPIVSSGRAAQIIYNKWTKNYNYIPDAYVVEGPKAGGHLGFKKQDIFDEHHSLENILADVLAFTEKIRTETDQKIPVIAAGGIFTGGDMYRIMQMGADAVQLGTRFVATEECDASQELKQAFVNASKDDIRIIESPVGMPGRAIYNDFLKEVDEGGRRPNSCNYKCIRSCNPRTTKYCIGEALLEACRGNFNNGFVFSGANAHLVKEITTVKEVIESLKKEYALAVRGINID